MNLSKFHGESIAEAIPINQGAMLILYKTIIMQGL